MELDESVAAAAPAAAAALVAVRFTGGRNRRHVGQGGDLMRRCKDRGHTKWANSDPETVRTCGCGSYRFPVVGPGCLTLGLAALALVALVLWV